MFFNSRKKKKLAKEARKKQELFLQEQKALKATEEALAFAENLNTFKRICDMVRSLPKKRQIVVVQRENVFFTDSDKNWYYLQFARSMKKLHLRTGQKWMCDFGENDDALYAFYEPTKVDDDFRKALEQFSKDGFRIQRIRYYSGNI